MSFSIGSIPPPLAPFTKRLPIRWWIFLMSFSIVSVVFSCIGCGWLSDSHSAVYEQGHRRTLQTATQALKDVTAVMRRLGIVVETAKSFVESQLRQQPTDEVAICADASRPEYLFHPTMDKRNRSIDFNAFMTFAEAVVDDLPMVGSLRARPCGVSATTSYPTGTPTGWPDIFNRSRENTEQNLNIYRFVAFGVTTYFAAINVEDPTPIFIAQTPIYRTPHPRLNMTWKLTLPDIHVPFEALEDFWGQSIVMVNIADLVKTVKIEKNLEGFSYLLRFYIAGGNVPILVAQSADLNVTSENAFDDDLQGGGRSTSRLVLEERLNEYVLIRLVVEPLRGLPDAFPNELEYLTVIIGVFAISFLIHLAWFGVIVRWMVVRERRVYRSRFAPQAPPVCMAVVQLSTPSNAWLEFPVEMGSVSRTTTRLVVKTVSEYSVCRTQSRLSGEFYEIVSRSPDELLTVVQSIQDALARHPWSAKEFAAFRDGVHVEGFIGIKATLHVLQRDRGVTCTTDRVLDAVAYKGPDVSELYMLHETTLQRDQALLLTSAFARMIRCTVTKKRILRIDKSDHCPPEYYSDSRDGEDRIETAFTGSSLRNEFLPLFAYVPEGTLQFERKVTVLTDNNTPQLMDAETPPPRLQRTQLEQLGVSASAEGGARPQPTDEDLLVDTDSDGSGSCSSRTSVGSFLLDPKDYGCDRATRRRIQTIAAESVSKKQIDHVVYVASYFFTAYSLTFAPFTISDFTVMAKAVDSAFSLKAALASQQELLERLSIRCARLFCGEFRHKDRWVHPSSIRMYCAQQHQQQQKQSILPHSASAHHTPPSLRGQRFSPTEAHHAVSEEVEEN